MMTLYTSNNIIYFHLNIDEIFSHQKLIVSFTRQVENDPTTRIEFSTFAARSTVRWTRQTYSCANQLWERVQ